MSTPGASVDLMVKDCFKAAVIPRLDAMPTILSIDELVKVIAQVAMSIKTSMWGGLHGCLALFLEEPEMRHVANAPQSTATGCKSRRLRTPTSLH